MKNLLLSLFMANAVNKRTTPDGKRPAKSRGIFLTVLFKHILKKRKARKAQRKLELQEEQRRLMAAQEDSLLMNNHEQ